MAELDRVKRNVGKMIDQGATEPEINQYLFSEKVTPDQLRTTPVSEAPKVEEDPYRIAARQELDKRKAAGVPSEASLTRQMVQGMTFNGADEILAGLNTPLEMISRGTFNPVEAYKHAKAREDLTVEDSRANNGALGTAAEILGGVGSGASLASGGITAARALAPNAGLAARALASGVDGLALGALAGGLEGNGSERLGNAVQGGLIGGAVGGVAPVAMSALNTVAAPIINNVRARINPEGFARSQVARGLIESGQAPADIARSVQQAAGEGQGMFTVADAMGNPGQRMLSTVARAPGVGRTETVNFLEGRQAGQGRRISSALAEGFDSPLTAAQTQAAMTTARDTAADAAYGAARSGARPVDVSNVISRIDDTLQPGVNRIASPQSGIADDGIESALSRVRSKLTDGRSVQSNYVALERLRKEIADDAQSALAGGRGNKARMLGQVIRELDTALEAASPGYRAANRQFAQASRNIGAIDEGATAATRGRTEDILPAFRGLAPEGQQGFRAGYVDPLIQQTQGAAYGVNKARPLLNDAFADESAVMAPGNPLMQRRIGRENQMFETRNHALGGSRTADNLADQSAMGIDATLIGNVLSGNYTGALRSVVASGANALSGNTPAVREEVARILLQRGQNVSPASIQRVLDEAVRRIEMVQTIARQLGRGAQGGVAVAPAALDQR